MPGQPPGSPKLRPNAALPAQALADGRAHLAQGRPEVAADIFLRALQGMPEHAGLLGALACVRNLQGRFAEAEAACRRALGHAPGNGGVLTELGNALAGRKRWAEAREAYRRAVAADPGLVAAQTGLARACFAAKRFAEAAQACRRVLAVRPEDSRMRLTLGRSLHKLGELDAALNAFTAFSPQDPAYAEAAYGAGCVLQHLGRIDEARAALTRALAGDPANARYHRILAGLKRFTPDDPQLAQMELLARRPERLSETGRVEICFALAKAYEDLGHYDAAFDRWCDGNARLRTRIAYDEAAQLEILSAVAETFAEPQPPPPGACADATPVFVVGMPRSGTTLVEQILASHPEAFGAGEIRAFADCVRAETPDPFGRGATDAEIARIGARYVDVLQRLAPGARRIVDKMPGNFLYAGLICRALPGARILHVHRDPRDTCISCFATLFTAGHHYAYDLGELARYYRAYETLMTHWRAILPPERFTDVSYETLVTDFPREAHRIVTFCGLDWADACLDFHRAARPVLTASAVQVRQPIYRHSIGRWRKFASRLDVLTTAADPEFRLD